MEEGKILIDAIESLRKEVHSSNKKDAKWWYAFILIIIIAFTGFKIILHKYDQIDINTTSIVKNKIIIREKVPINIYNRDNKIINYNFDLVKQDKKPLKLEELKIINK